MNKPNLLVTKFHIPPRRAGLVAHPCPKEQLQRGLDENRKLTLISAPAGCGKSILVADWIANLHSSINNQKSAIFWLSLEASDNQPERFFTYFVAARRQSSSRWISTIRWIMGALNITWHQDLLEMLKKDIS